MIITAAVVVAITGLSAIIGLSIGNSVATAAPNDAPNAAPSSQYAALGDSIAAGAGLPLSSNPSTQDLACDRSPSGYPTILAKKLNVRLTNLSCGGASTTDGLIGAQQLNTVTAPSQLDRAFENGAPKLITITVGANDIRWVQLVSKCYVDSCGGVKDSAVVAGYLTYLQGKLAYTLHQVKDRSGSNTPPKVLVTGYYNPISSTSCLNGQVTARELAWINSETDNLNKAIRQTVNAASKITSYFNSPYNFATYVPISFAGHGLCSPASWVQDQNDSAPVHPTAIGAAKIADMLYSYAR